MVIVAIGFGNNTAPYTHSCVCNDDECDPYDLDGILWFLHRQHNIHSHNTDELYVIQEDRVVSHFTSEDGLRQLEEDETTLDDH